ncbi:hypothetical protein EE612_003444, partial [Oryza sativa]
ILFWTIYAQMITFSVEQATTMDRRVGAGFEIPAASLTVFWLGDTIDRSRLDYFYWLLAVLSVLNLAAYLVCAKWAATAAATSREQQQQHTAVADADEKC